MTAIRLEDAKKFYVRYSNRDNKDHEVTYHEAYFIAERPEYVKRAISNALTCIIEIKEVEF